MEIKNNELQELIEWIKKEKGVSTMNTEALKQYYEEFKLSKGQESLLKVNESDIIK